MSDPGRRRVSLRTMATTVGKLYVRGGQFQWPGFGSSLNGTDWLKNMPVGLRMQSPTLNCRSSLTCVTTAARGTLLYSPPGVP